MVRLGRKQGPDSYAAGAAAARAAVDGRTAELVVVFASIGYDFDAMLAGVRDVAGSVPLVGCSTFGQFTVDGVLARGVAVAAFGGPGFTVNATVSRGASERRREAGREVAEYAHRCRGAAQDLAPALRRAYS